MGPLASTQRRLPTWGPLILEVRQLEHVNVLIVGAGLSGIGAACHLRRSNPHHDFVILEGRESLGGTWDLFRYPGVRSDSDMYTFGYSFKPWREKRDIASAESILQYLNEAVDEYRIRDAIRFRRRVKMAQWCSQDRRWTVTVEDARDGTVTEITCDFLLTCTGYYNYDRGYLPRFEGYDDYAGLIAHPQHWPEDLDCAGKRVLVIGSGATAVTLVPALAGVAQHVTMLQRSPTYMFTRPAVDRVALRLRALLPARAAHAVTRARNIVIQRGLYAAARARPEKTRRRLRNMAKRRVGPDIDVDVHFNPRYDPWDQRLCLMPDGDFYAALREGSASIVTDTIERFVETGVVTSSGDRIEADVVVPATGLRLQFLGGIQMKVDGELIDPSKLVTYKGVMFAGVPNWVSVSGYTSASWTLKADLVAGYVCRLLRYMRAHGYDTVTPRPDERAVPVRPMVDKLKSGYVRRGAAESPKQGRGGPWVNSDDYLSDLFSLKWARLSDGVLGFGRAPSSSRFELRGKTAVITGAASGIGAALAEELAGRGCQLALVDVSSRALESVAERVRAHGVQVSTHLVDVGDPRAIDRFVAELPAAHARVDLLINNAGLALAGSFLQATRGDFDEIMRVNFGAVVNLTRALLPGLLARPEAHIANLSSVFGLVAPPGQAAYSASKFAVRGFTEALASELASTRVGVSVVHPGGIKTSIVRNARMAAGLRAEAAQATEKELAAFERNLITSPQKAAAVIVSGIQRRQRRILVGPDARLIDSLARLLPGRAVDFLGRVKASKAPDPSGGADALPRGRSVRAASAPTSARRERKAI